MEAYYRNLCSILFFVCCLENLNLGKVFLVKMNEKSIDVKKFMLKVNPLPWAICYQLVPKVLYYCEQGVVLTTFPSVKLTAHNWQKWKRVFLTYHCHEIYRDDAVGLKSCKHTWKITIYVNMCNLGKFRENLTFLQ